MSTIPFTQPYTAPDGTARRPLSERVPECVPKIDAALGLATGEYAFPAPSVAVPSGAVSALWRVAVEDWIDSKTLGVRVTGDCGVCVLWGNRKEGRNKAEWLVLADGERYWQEWFDDLNAAAHAVADAKGVPK